MLRSSGTGSRRVVDGPWGEMLVVPVRMFWWGSGHEEALELEVRDIRIFESLEAP